MSNNSNLRKAKKTKNDEFYTQLPDIENELRHYRDHFKGKVVYCNCDDARESNFFKYFSINFEFLGLKKLIATGYKKDGRGVLLVYEGDKNGNKVVDDEEVTVTELEGDGDFRSPECVKLLDEADVVVTNPPFSLFREYVAQLVEHGKKFLIIGNMNALTYKEIFPLIKANKIWVGHNFNKTMEFRLDESYEKWNEIRDGFKYGKVPAISWYTNLDMKKRHEKLVLTEKYDPAKYPKYDNYDAINVDKTVDIPKDYDGAMGVPITFLDKYNPEQFEIINGFNNSCIEKKAEWNYVPSKDTPTIINGIEKMWNGPVVNKQPKYYRIIIKRKPSGENKANPGA